LLNYTIFDLETLVKLLDLTIYNDNNSNNDNNDDGDKIIIIIILYNTTNNNNAVLHIQYIYTMYFINK